MMFTFVYSSWEETMIDARVFFNALTGPEVQFSWLSEVITTQKVLFYSLL